jgi:membrane fusion protein
MDEQVLRDIAGGRGRVATGGDLPENSPPEKSQPLFRPEALAARDAIQWGKPVGEAPISWSVILGVLVVIVAAALIFLMTANYARKETVRGILRAQGGETRIVASDPGIIRSLHVVEGQLVAKGDLLAVIGAERVSEGGGFASDDVLAALQQEEASLIARLDALASSIPLAGMAAVAETEALVAERQAAQDAIAAAEERQKLAAERVALAKPVRERGFLSADELRRREDALIVANQAVADARSRAAALEARIERARALAARTPHDLAQTRGLLEGQRAAVSQRRAQAEASRGYELRAQSSGRVTALQAVLGQPVDRSRPLMTISPADPVLISELYVPSRAAGFVEPGQSVRLLYDAFPFQRFGAARGEVMSVSSTVLTPTEVNAAVKLEEPVYRVLVRLDRQSVDAFGRPMALQVGMALTADIILENRSLMEWLLQPIHAIRGRM